MNIKNSIGCINTTSSNQKKSVGHFIPASWYKHIINSKNGADLHAILLLAEILYWYRPGKDGKSKLQNGVFETSYRILEDKFCCSKQTLRRAFVKLEDFGLVRRELKTYIRYGMKRNNVLCVILLNKNLIDNPDDIGIYKGKKISTPHYKMSPASLQDDRDIIDNKKNNNDNRSTNLESKNSKSESNSKKRKLVDFYPLTEKDCEILKTQSGRDFNLNAMNEILLSMSKRLSDREFYSKKAFLNYMTKALESEMRQSVRVNNPFFRISENKSYSEMEDEKAEKFLEQIETSSDISELGKIKKKLSGLFETQRSYQILNAFSSIVKSENNRVILSFSSHIKLNDFEKERIAREVLSVVDIYGEMNERQIEFVFDGVAHTIPRLGIKSDTNSIKMSPIFSNNIWGKVRKSLREYYGTGVDISWFSNLQAEIDEDSQKYSLTAPNKFMKDWLDSHYKAQIISFSRYFGFELENIEWVE